MTWFFTYRCIFPGSEYFKKYDYLVAGAIKGKLGLLSISYSDGAKKL